MQSQSQTHIWTTDLFLEQGFYEEVAIPLLTSVQMNYTGATNLTQTIFSYYYNGSEIVVAGQITDNNINDFTTEVIAISVRVFPHNIND